MRSRDAANVQAMENQTQAMDNQARALLDADVSFKIAKEFTQRVKEKSLGKNVLTDLRPGAL